MIDVQKKTIKTIDDYRHSIKLLKYNLKKQKKVNEKLKYQAAKFHHKPQPIHQKPNRVYELSQTTKMVSDRLKRMGLLLEDLFRMADNQYQGQITKEQFMKVVTQLKIQLSDSIFTEMFYAIDSSLNNLVSQDEYIQFSIAYGGCSDTKQIRKYQNKAKIKLLGAIKKNHGSLQNFLQKFNDPIVIDILSKQLRKMNLNNNEVMVLLKTFDPTHLGLADQKFILSIMESGKQKTEREQQNDEVTKNINQLCVMLRDKKINPIEVFQQADIDGQKGITPFQLEQAFKKLVPSQTPFQIKKWVSLINFNNDKIITKEEFINAIRGFYSINQIGKFSEQYAKKHPELKLQLNNQSTEKILKSLNNAIEDKGLSRRQAFDFFDFNKSQDIDKQQLIEGLKSLGLNIGFIHRVVAIFDTNNSEKIEKEQWLRILGDDPVMSEVAENLDLSLESSEEKEKIKDRKLEKSKKKSGNQKILNEKKEENKKNKNKPSQQTNKSVSKVNAGNNNKKNDQKSKSGFKKAQNGDIASNLSKNIANDKKFKEDENFEDKKKGDQKKKKPDPAKHKDSRRQQSQILDDGKLSDQEQNVDRIQEEVGIKYKKNKKQVLKQFKKFDQEQKGKVNKKNFAHAIKQILPSIPQKQITQIFLRNVVNVNQFPYSQWLQLIQNQYAQQAEIQNSWEEKQKQNREKEEDGKISASDNDPLLEESKDKEGSQLKGRKEEKNQKRGENIPAFQILANTLNLIQGRSIEIGYKLIDYISDEQNQLQKTRQLLLKKALQIKNNHQIFEDKDFPPNPKSLYSGKSQCRINNQSLLSWKHYKKIFKNPKLFNQSVDPNDIKQGNLGDCYFLSALAGLAEYTNLIQRLFQYYDIQTGYFLIWMCIGGSWKLVQIDGYLPVRRPDQKPAFSYSQSQQLWVSLLEKAYAKCYGEYNNIVGGQPIQAIKDLTGAPGNQFQFKKFTQQQIWQMLLQADKKQYIMTAGTKLEEVEGKVEGHQESVTNTGIVLGHAYSILDCRSIKQERIMKLRNPWGETQWTGGNWSDNGKRWTKQIKKQLNYESNEKDGIFWIQLQQFYKNFMACSISYLRPTFYYRSDKISKVQSFIVVISNPFKFGYVSVSHKDHRQEGLQPNIPYDGVYKLLGMVQKNGQIIQKFQQKCFLYQRQGFIEFKDMNRYEVGFQTVTLVKLNKTTDVTVSFYGDTNLDFRIETKFENYLQKLAYFEQRSKQAKVDKQNKLKLWKCQIQGIIFLCFKNLGEKTISMRVKLQNLENLKPVPPLSTNQRLKIVPGEIKNIRLKILTPSNKSPQSNKVSYSYSYSVQQ